MRECKISKMYQLIIINLSYINTKAKDFLYDIISYTSKCVSHKQAMTVNAIRFAYRPTNSLC